MDKNIFNQSKNKNIEYKTNVNILHCQIETKNYKYAWKELLKQ